MPPKGSETGNRNFDLIVQLGIWARQDGTGIGFDSSAGFTLPNGAIKSSFLARRLLLQRLPVTLLRDTYE